MQCTLGLGCFLPGAVTNQSTALGQAKVEGQQGAMLHTDSPQRGAINLQGRGNNCIDRYRIGLDSGGCLSYLEGPILVKNLLL